MNLRQFFASSFLVGRSFAQTFDVASLKPSPRTVGPDYNNQLTIAPQTLGGKNVTLKCLVMEAYGLQSPQVTGPKWIDEMEFDLQARSGAPTGREQFRTMLRFLLSERFHLKAHHERRDMRVMELTGSPKVQPVADSEPNSRLAGGRFRGTMTQLAGLLSVQLSIIPGEDPTKPSMASKTPLPVLDRTGAIGSYEFPMTMDPAVDPLEMWQRILQEQLGLKLETRKSPLEILVIDSADRVPVAN